MAETKKMSKEESEKIRAKMAAAEEAKATMNQETDSKPVNIPALQTVAIPLEGITAIINTLATVESNLLEMEFKNTTGSEMTKFLTYVGDIQKCIQYLGGIAKGSIT